MLGYLLRSGQAWTACEGQAYIKTDIIPSRVTGRKEKSAGDISKEQEVLVVE
jgi:hypothetical protein